MGGQGACDVTYRRRAEEFGEIWRKLESWVLDAKRGGSTFGARRREANLRPMGAARDGGQMNKTACVSPPYVETFNSNLIKRFRTWTRSRYVFSNFEIRMFFICSEFSIWTLCIYEVMNIRSPFHPFRTWPYSCTWLCNNILFCLNHISKPVRCYYSGSELTW